MTPEELFDRWAPRYSIWSPWVKPVLFAHAWPGMKGEAELILPAAPMPFSADMAIVVDLPGVAGLHMGLALAAIGYRPIPLYNAVPFASEGFKPDSTAVELMSVMRGLEVGARLLAALILPNVAPPAFLIDANRSVSHIPLRNASLDNRSLVLPSDFPSASFLWQHGVRRVVLIQPTSLQPQPDLAHVLLRWQEAGVPTLSRPLDAEEPTEVRIARPNAFRALWYDLLATLRFRPVRLGGFSGVLGGYTMG